jgi:DNA-binding MltR family transcriptional regulator
MTKKTEKKRRVVPIDELNLRVLVESATEGTELACALIAGAFIEQALGNLLAAVMIPENESDGLLKGVLGTAAARANISYCLGLIDETTWENAKTIAEVRNQFAHSHTPVGFADPQIRELCNRLVEPPLIHKDGTPVDAKTSKGILEKPRQKFVTAAQATFVSILVEAWASSRQERTKPDIKCIVSEDGSSVIGPGVFS